ncbi:MAG TPA: hypothetical protein VIE15_07070 [Acidimicrobiales bacterium]
MSTRVQSIRPSRRRRALLAPGAAALVVGLVLAPAVAASAVDTPPAITSVVVSPALLGPSGGTVTLTAVVTNTAGGTCSVIIKPPPHSPPAAVACSGARVKVKFFWDRDSNAKASPSTDTVTFTAKGHYSDGTSRSTTATRKVVVEAYQWVQKSSMVTLPMAPTALSCATTTRCVAVGTHSGAVLLTSGKPTSIAPKDGTHTLTSVSCVAGPPVQCVAVDDAGHYLFWNGTSWSLPATVAAGGSTPGPHLTSVSCATAASVTWCQAVGDGGGAVGLEVAKGKVTVHGEHLTVGSATPRVSCVAPTDCVAVDAGGHGLGFNGETAGSAVSFSLFADGGTKEGGVTALSCATKVSCFVGSTSGSTQFVRPLTPVASVAEAFVSMSPLVTVSLTCPLPTYCLAGTTGGVIYQLVSHGGGGGGGSGGILSLRSWTVVKNMPPTCLVGSVPGATGALPTLTALGGVAGKSRIVGGHVTLVK